MKKLSDKEMASINGGASYFSATLVSALTKAGSTLFDIGRSLGSAIRRIYEKDICSL